MKHQFALFLSLSLSVINLINSLTLSIFQSLAALLHTASSSSTRNQSSPSPPLSKLNPKLCNLQPNLSLCPLQKQAMHIDAHAHCTLHIEPVNFSFFGYHLLLYMK